MIHKFYLLYLGGCSRNRYFEGWIVVISQQYIYRQKQYIYRPPLYLQATGTLTKKSCFTFVAAAFTYHREREGYEVVALALEEEFFVVFLCQWYFVVFSLFNFEKNKISNDASFFFFFGLVSWWEIAAARHFSHFSLKALMIRKLGIGGHLNSPASEL